MQTPVKIGIDDMAAYIPQLYLPISSLADARGLEYPKLNKGLGLEAMSVADAHEDVATMAANAVLALIRRNGLLPSQIGRIYMGTESALDGAKPMATYVLDMLTQYFAEEHGPDCLLHCDAVDLTFACIGSVDALQNTLDWASADPSRIGIVVGSDVARYELGSGGEYTQGAGAVAMLVRHNPRLLSFHETWGVATRPVHDFFKPVRAYSKTEIVAEVLRLAGLPESDADRVLSKLEHSAEGGLLSHWDEAVQVHRDTPVFDGPYSNDCYQQRITEALADYCAKSGQAAQEPVIDDWHRLVFHLPYAYQARRMFSEVFVSESQKRGDWERTVAEVGADMPQAADFESGEAYQKARSGYLRSVTKTARYRNFVAEKIEKGERASSLVGNLYTSSVFLALMSTLEADLQEGNKLSGEAFGFFAYGSGSKSKVFTATVETGWEEVARRFKLSERLQGRTLISSEQYERLHRGQQQESVAPPQGSFFLKNVIREKGVREGLREYAWQKRVAEPATAVR